MTPFSKVLFIPGIESQPFLNLEMYPIVTRLEKAFEAINAEVTC